MFRAVDDRVLASNAAGRRAFARVVRRLGRGAGLFAFGLADTHGHVGLACTDARVGRFAHDARIALGAALGTRLAAAVQTPIRDVWHAENVLAYIHRQDARHGAGLDPLREATSLPDLCGLRPDGVWLADRARELLPRLTRADLLAQWGAPALEEAHDLATLAESGAAAVAAPELRGRSDGVVAARRACVHAGEAPTAALAAALGVSRRAVRALRHESPDPRLVRAVRLQMGLRKVVEGGNRLLG